MCTMPLAVTATMSVFNTALSHLLNENAVFPIMIATLQIGYRNTAHSTSRVVPRTCEKHADSLMSSSYTISNIHAHRAPGVHLHFTSSSSTPPPPPTVDALNVLFLLHCLRVLPTSILHRGTTGPFSLVIPPTTYCPGSAVEGEVLLKFLDVQENKIDEVVVELRGTLRLRVLTGHNANGQRIYSTSKHHLVSLRTTLWKRGSAYPPPDSHVLHLSFRFTLPSSDTKILPSVSWADSGGHGGAANEPLVPKVHAGRRAVFAL
uniref:Two-component-like hybrid sensor histidine kinase 1 n=1 Tax=Ganoderma boninense TaxID=34458 RepID=A0A5K1JYA8_9APHY|nr:Two-component-like hybrid sensor histidine kinase 1 [Ganoderma boninense]